MIKDERQISSFVTQLKSIRSDSPHNVLSNLACFQYTEVKSFFYYEALHMFGVLE